MPAAPAMLSLDALGRLRQGTYRLMGAAFLYPDERRLPRLVSLARALRRHRARAVAFTFYPQWSRCVDALASAGSAPERLRRTFVRTFLINPVTAPCLAQECAYVEGRDGTGGLLAALEREYAAAGLVMADTGEPADHVAVELEFMAFLCGSEAAAWDADARAVRRLLARERGFLDLHLARWLPAFVERLAAMPDAGIYGSVGEAVNAFVQHDRGLIELVDAVVPAGP